MGHEFCYDARKDKLQKKEALARIAKVIKYTGAELHIYKCPFCHFYHLTSQKQGGRR